MKIQVEVKSNYGSQAVYPRCETAKLLCDLARQRTMTPDAIKTIKALGYSIEVIQPTVTL
jgi:hypothetical protein